MTMVIENCTEEQRALSNLSESYTVIPLLLSFPTLSEIRKICTSFSFPESLLSQRKSKCSTLIWVKSLSEPYIQIILPFPQSSHQNSWNSSSSELLLIRKPYAQDVTLIEEYKKEGIIPVHYNYFLKCRYVGRVQVMWKVFVEDGSLVTLNYALNYRAKSKLGNYDLCVQYHNKLAFMLHLQRIEDTSTLLTQVETLWDNRNGDNIR